MQMTGPSPGEDTTATLTMLSVERPVPFDQVFAPSVLMLMPPSLTRSARPNESGGPSAVCGEKSGVNAIACGST